MAKPPSAARRGSLVRPSLTESPLLVRPGATRASKAETRVPSWVSVVRPKPSAKTKRAGSGLGRGNRTAPSIGAAGSSGRASSGRRVQGRGFLPMTGPRHPRQQRVVVKVRVVKNRGRNGRRTLARHVDYVEREGVSAEGGRGESFGRDGLLSASDVSTFVETARDDRHHFRLIVTPERGGDLDLRRYTQSLMTQVEVDLGTRVTWLAVEHHNTEHPHVHVIVRGVDARGADLVINRSYVGQGFRARGEEIATRELGLRSERELARERARELVAGRVTYVDRRMIDEASRSQGIVDARPVVADRAGHRAAFQQQKRARLQFLESQGLATPAGPGQWTLAADLPAQLEARAAKAIPMPERGPALPVLPPRTRGFWR